MKTLFTKSALLAAAVLQTFVTVQALAQDTNGGAVFARNYGQVPMRFEPNVGLADPYVRYLSRGDGYSMYFAPDGVALALDVSTNADESRRFARFRKPAIHQFGMAYLEFEDANTGAVISAEQALPEKINYFIGNDPSKWRTDVSAFGRVRYQSIYPGIDLAFYGNESHLEYDFVVDPHANPGAIQIKLRGVDRAAIETNGDLALTIRGRTICFRRPSIYQRINGTRREIAGGYRLRGSAVCFEIGAYDSSQPLVIDPVLSYSSFLGGVGGAGTEAWQIACDSAGDAYVSGDTTASFTNIWTGATFQTNFAGGGQYYGDAFVAKIGPTGTNLIYLTYLGGSGDDIGIALAVDSSGNAFVGGYTGSSNFPITNALYPTLPSTYNSYFGFQPVSGFVAELNTNGTQLIYSTYLGSTGPDSESLVEAIAVDSEDNAYVTGTSYGTTFPVTAHAMQNHYQGTNGTIFLNPNAYVTEIASNDANLVYSTYFGGTNYDVGVDIAVDTSNYVYVAGYTGSFNFPTSNVPTNLPSGQYLNDSTVDNWFGHFDAFAAKFPPLASQPSSVTNLVYSFFLGGGQTDYGYGVAVDTNGNAYIAGLTYSLNFPTNNGLDISLNSGDGNTSVSDAFVTKLSPLGSVIYSTYLGGSNTDIAYGIAAQNDGDAVIVGQTGSIDFAPYDNYGSINSGDLDAFVAKLNSSGNALVNFAYLGGNASETAYGVAVDNEDNVYICGRTSSTNFPVSSTNVFDPNFGSKAVYTNAFVTKLYFEPNQLGTEVITSWQNTNGWSVGGMATMAASNVWPGVSQIASVSSNGVTSLSNSRFQRGVSYDPAFTSFVIPLSQQTGFRLDDLGNNSESFSGSYPWFTRLQCDTRTHLSLVSSTNTAGVSTNYYNYVTNFNNPIVAFGANAGQLPLYVGQQFQFGVYCGFQYESTNGLGTNFAAPLRILVYKLSSFTNGQTNLIAPIATNYVAIPRQTVDTNWWQFATNGFSVTTNAYGLRTIVKAVIEAGGAWGTVPEFTNAQDGDWLITQECTTNLGYGYVLEGLGAVPLSTNLYPMVTNSTGLAWDRLYSMDFETRPPWLSTLITEPQFNGIPAPSFYQGASPTELTNEDAVLTNSIPLVGSAYTTLNDSPELLDNPTLDQAVANLNNDPIAIANYVLNSIQLTDVLSYNPNNGDASAPTVNEGGVNRSAYDVYMEGEGSPVEQCALLVYMLRQAGYPAAYVFPTNNNVQVLDTRLSALLRMQLHGAVNQYGQLYTSNSLITVNYPWVVTTVSNQTVQIFPWLKDTKITEGLDLYNYMPTNYSSGFLWLQHYIYGDTNILDLNPESDEPAVLFPEFVNEQLLENAPGISLDDIGVTAVDRQNYCTSWPDFPTPTIVNNPAQVAIVDSLASPAITNVAPTMTNIFDTVTLNIYSQQNTNESMTVGPLRMADLHNREMFLATNGAGAMTLWLAPYLSSNTNQSAFDATDPFLTNCQVATLTITTNDSSFDIVMTHNRDLSLNFTPPPNQYLGISDSLVFSTPARPFNLQDVVAICFNVGRVTPAMMDVHAQAFQQMTYQWSLNTNWIPPVASYQAAAAYMMGMDYYSHVSSFLPVCEQLHKVQVVSWYAEGISRLTPVQLGAQQFMRPSLDMFYSEMAHAGNGTSHPDSGNDTAAGADDFSSIMDGEIAAEEHGIINGYYQSENTVSSVVLLRLAQQRMTNGVSGIIELNENNYQTIGAENAAGYGETPLEDYDPTIWAAVTNVFQGWQAPYVRAYITPGPESVVAANYRGMGLVIVGPGESASIISVNMNGALGPLSSYFGSTPAALSTTYSTSLPGDSFTASADLDESTSYGSSAYGGDLYYGGSGYGGDFSDYYWEPPDWLGIPVFIPYNPMAQYQTRATVTPPSQVNVAQEINDLYNLPQSTPVTTSLTHELDSGNTGTPTWKNRLNYVAEPVNVMSGEFYEDVVDLTVAGPQPLQVRRNYSSQNQSDLNGFGYGWNINIVPYISVATNTTLTTTNVVIAAVDLDGSVIAYRQQSSNSNLFLPTLGDNPQLDNFGDGRIGSIYNPFNASIVHSFSGTNELYTLTQADGDVRTYIVNSFPVVTATNAITRERPYLSIWQDTQGNTWTFAYDTNSNDSAYGSVVRINASNGNYLGFDYNAAGYVNDAYTSDGERTAYQYDDFGDLVGVTRADGSQETYQYQHIQYTNNGTVYLDSTHLLVFDYKPDGRTLENVYDSQRRVTNQLATCGADLNLYTNATFTYFNNFNITNAYTNHLSGYTIVKDVNGNSLRYDYTNGLVTTNTDELGHQIIQNWYADNATSPGYPRSPYQIRDKRGLWTQFQYDQFGNLTNSFSWGDLTGNGTTVYATNTASYNSNNLPVQITDPVGNSVETVYSSQYPYLPQHVIFAPGGIPTVTNEFLYCCATNVVVNGNLTLTNIALGLLQQQISAANSPDAASNQWSYDGRGYVTQEVQFTGTGDPAVTNYFVCDNQGEIIQRTDAAGQTTTFGYDDMHRPTSHEVFAAGQSVPLFSEFLYYNDNGEVNWYQGPRYNPANYEYFDYDGAGRLTTQIHWRSEANTNGTGMEAPAGDNVYAQFFNQYDKFGDLTLSVGPRTAMVTNKWDAVGQLLQSQHLDTNGVTVLSAEQFGYEPGGLVNAYTNPLGGVTLVTYTTTGQPEFQRNPDGSTNGWLYYLDGRLQRRLQSNGAYWQMAYDDVNRIITSTFCSAAGVPEATNSVQLDQRGNVIQRTDAGFNVFTTTYDGLNRVKSETGPAILTVNEASSGMAPPLTNSYVTNVLQQSFTNYFDAAGQVLTNVNALGEMTVTYFDALRRPTEVQIFDSAATLVRQRTWSYSADFNSVTMTDGSGANAISHTIYTDNDNQPVLDVAYPSSGVTEFVLNQYDLDENLISQQHCSSGGGAPTAWTTANFTYDGLNRVTSKTDRDGALTTYSYNPMSELTNTVLPGGVLQWRASYNNAGQLLKDFETSGTAGMRTNTYSYFVSGSPYAGLLQTNVDGRGVSCAYAYDDWLRPVSVACSGSKPEQNMTTTWGYEPRGYITNIIEEFTNAAIGPATMVTFAHDPYGQLSSESVSEGSFGYGAGQTWDAAGRRTMLTFGDADYSFGWRADGNLTYASDPTGSGSYSFDTAGLLTTRTVGNRQTSITSRDGEGRPLSISTTVNTLSTLTESLGYSGDGLLTSDKLYRPDFKDSRSYNYANLSRRLTQEQLNLNALTTWTNSFVYDQGVSGGLGVLTTMGQIGQNSGLWDGAPDAFSRVNTETNNTFSYAAYGHANGQATLSAWLDGNPIPIMGLGTNAMQWRATMELSPGTHQLEVAAEHPSGFYTAWATNTFTDNLAYEAATNVYDYAGFVTNRIWKNPSGTVYHTQYLSWDAHGRLHQVIDRDANNSGYNWSAVSDALGRRLSTTTILVTNGVAYPASSQTLNSVFDPEVEFLELAVQDGDMTTFKLYGPDSDGQYGGLNGVGGFEGTSPYLNEFDPTISDARGDILGEITNGAVSWFASRPTGYGAVPGYRPASFGNGADLAEASAWRGREVDITGLYNLGERDYDPVSGKFLSFDPLWNNGDPDGYSFCGIGDPINYFDPLGLFGKPGGYSVPLFPGKPGTGYPLNEFYENAGRSTIGWDQFDKYFHSQLSQATQLYPFGSMRPWELEVGRERGYINIWQMPIDAQSDGRGTAYAMNLQTLVPAVLLSGYGESMEAPMAAFGRTAPEMTTEFQASMEIPASREGITLTGMRAMYPRNALLSPMVDEWGGSIRSAESVARPTIGNAGATSARLQYLGSTPGKWSRTGLAVQARMQAEGNLLRVGNNTMVRYYDPTLSRYLWTDIANTDMAHRIDAVSWWNSVGINYGPKSPEVRAFMLYPDNYELQPYWINRSRGAILNERYQQY